MNTELIINGTQTIQEKEIKSITGGFGENQKCMLASDIAIMHEVTTPDINKLINRNYGRFTKNDLIDLKNCQSSNDQQLESLGFTQMQLIKAKNIFLLSERGYQKLVSMMSNTNEKKWEVLDLLIEEYFTMREIIQSDEQKKAQLLLQLYNGGLDSIEAHKKLSEIETKPLLEKIEEQAPKVTYCEEVLKPDGLITITDIAKDLGMSGQKLNKILKEKGIIYKSGQCWKPYANYQYLVPEYCDYEISGNGFYTSQLLKWTELGRKFIIEEVLEIDLKSKNIA